MTPDELAGIQTAFSTSIEPMVAELRGIHRVLQDHSQLLRNIDDRIVRVEDLLRGRADPERPTLVVVGRVLRERGA